MENHSLTCAEVRQRVLDFGWDEAEAEKAGQALLHLAQCEACRMAMRDYSAIRDYLKQGTMQAEPASGWDAFTAKLVTAPTVERHTFYSIYKIAAMLMLALGIGWFAGRDIGRVPAVGPNAPDLQQAGLSYSSKEITEQSSAFGELSKVYENKASWCMFSEKSADIGLAASASVKSDKLLLLRLTMLKDGKTVSQSSLAIVAGQSASLSLPLGDGADLRYQVGTSAAAPTQLDISAEVARGKGDRAIQLSMSTRLDAKPGEVMHAGQLVTSTGKFDLAVSLSQAKLPEVGL